MPTSMRTICRITIIIIALALFAALSARADLRDYEPLEVTVAETATTLLAADNQLQVVTLTNTGSVTVWICHGNRTPVAGRGFCLAAGASITFSGPCVPQQGLKAISSSGDCTVAVGRG